MLHRLPPKGPARIWAWRFENRGQNFGPGMKRRHVRVLIDIKTRVHKGEEMNTQYTTELSKKLGVVFHGLPV